MFLRQGGETALGRQLCGYSAWVATEFRSLGQHSSYSSVTLGLPGKRRQIFNVWRFTGPLA